MFAQEQRVLYDLRQLAEWRAAPDLAFVVPATSASGSATLAAKAVSTPTGPIPSNVALPRIFIEAYARHLSCWQICSLRSAHHVALLTDISLDMHTIADHSTAELDVADVSGMIKQWSANIRHDLYPAWRRMAFSGDGAIIVVAYSDGVVDVLEAATGTRLHMLSTRHRLRHVNITTPYANFDPVARLLFVAFDQLAERRTSSTHSGKCYEYEMLIVTFHGAITSYGFNRSATVILRPEVLHKVSLTKQHSIVCDATIYEHSNNSEDICMVIAGTELKHDSTSITTWNLLPSKPWYRRTYTPESMLTDDNSAEIGVTVADEQSVSWLKGIIEQSWCRRSRSKKSVSGTAIRAVISPNRCFVAVLDLVGNLCVLDITAHRPRFLERCTEGAMRALIHERIRGNNSSSSTKNQLKTQTNQEESPEKIPMQELDSETNLPRHRRPSFLTDEDIDTDQIASVEWWSNASLTLAFISGATTICNLPNMTLLLPNEIEYFNRNITMSTPFNNDFFVLDCQVEYVRVRAKDRNIPLAIPMGFGLDQQQIAIRTRARILAQKTYNAASTLMRYVTDTLLWHFESDITQNRVFITVPQRHYRLIQFRHASAKEMLLRRLAQREYTQALRLCTEYLLDADIVYQTQWLRTPPENIGKATIEALLGPMHDKVWVARACVECVTQTPETERDVLQYGLSQTNSIRDQLTTFNMEESSLNDDSEDTVRLLTIVKLRLLLFRHLDRLELFERMCKLDNSAALMTSVFTTTSFVASSVSSPSSAPSTVSYPDSTKQQHDTLTTTIPFSQLFATFRDTNIVKLAAQCAASQRFQALHLLFQTHGHVLQRYHTLVLNNIPEAVDPSEYYTLLPTNQASPYIDHHSRADVPALHLENWREPDWIETPALLDRVQWHDDCAEFELERSSGLGTNQSLTYTPPSLSQWYSLRAHAVEYRTGRADLALKLVTFARAHNVVGLDDLAILLHALNDLVYHCFSASDNIIYQLSLTDIEKKTSKEILRLYFYDTEEDTDNGEDVAGLDESYITIICRKHIIPLLHMMAEEQRHQQRRYYVANPQQTLCEVLVELSNTHIEWCTAILEASSPALDDTERIITDDRLMARTVLDVIYACQQADAWGYLDRIYLCCPVFDEDDIENDNTLAQLSQDITALDNHLASGETLFKYSIEYTISRVRATSQDVKQQEQCLQQLLHGGRTTSLTAPLRFPSDEAWQAFTQDVLSLRDSNLLSQLEESTTVCTLFQLLLRESIFPVARDLFTQYHHSITPPTIWETLALSVSRDLIRACELGSASNRRIQQALKCLTILPLSESLQHEIDFIAAIDKLVSAGVCLSGDNVVLPHQIQQYPDKLHLISLYIHHSGNYTDSQAVIDLACGLGQRSLVHEAQVRDLVCLYSVERGRYGVTDHECDALIALYNRVKNHRRDSNNIVVAAECDKIRDITLTACLRVAKCEAYRNFQRKKMLLAYVLLHTADTQMSGVLTLWKDVDIHNQLPYVDLLSLQAINSTFSNYLTFTESSSPTLSWSSSSPSSPSAKSKMNRYPSFYKGSRAEIISDYGLVSGSSPAVNDNKDVEHNLWALLRSSNSLILTDRISEDHKQQQSLLTIQKNNWTQDTALQLAFSLSASYNDLVPTNSDNSVSNFKNKEQLILHLCLRLFASLWLVKLYEVDLNSLNMPRLQYLSSTELLAWTRTLLSQRDWTERIQSVSHTDLRKSINTISCALKQQMADQVREQHEQALEAFVVHSGIGEFDEQKLQDNADYRLECLSMPIILVRETAFQATIDLARRFEMTLSEIILRAIRAFVHDTHTDKQWSVAEALVLRHFSSSIEHRSALETILTEMNTSHLETTRFFYRLLKHTTPSTSPSEMNSVNSTQELQKRIDVISSMLGVGITSFDFTNFMSDRTLLSLTLKQNWSSFIHSNNVSTFSNIAKQLYILQPIFAFEPPSTVEKSEDFTSVIYEICAHNYINNTKISPLLRLAQVTDYVDHLVSKELESVYQTVIHHNDLTVLSPVNIEKFLLTMLDRLTELMDTDNDNKQTYIQVQKLVEQQLTVYTFLIELETQGILEVFNPEQLRRIKQGDVINKDSLTQMLHDIILHPPSSLCTLKHMNDILTCWNTALLSNQSSEDKDMSVSEQSPTLAPLELQNLLISLVNNCLNNRIQAESMISKEFAHSSEAQNKIKSLTTIINFVFNSNEENTEFSSIQSTVQTILNEYASEHELSTQATEKDDKFVTQLLKEHNLLSNHSIMQLAVKQFKQQITETWPDINQSEIQSLTADVAADLFVRSTDDKQRRIAVKLLKSVWEEDSQEAAFVKVASWMIEHDRLNWMISFLISFANASTKKDTALISLENAQLIIKLAKEHQATWGQQLLLILTLYTNTEQEMAVTNVIQNAIEHSVTSSVTTEIESDLFVLLICGGGLLRQVHGTPLFKLITSNTQQSTGSPTLSGALLRIVDFVRTSTDNTQDNNEVKVEMLVVSVIRQLMKLSEHWLATWIFLDLHQIHPLARYSQMAIAGSNAHPPIVGSSTSLMQRWLSTRTHEQQYKLLEETRQENASKTVQIEDEMGEITDMQGLRLAWNWWSYHRRRSQQ